MSMERNPTHDPAARSFVESANVPGCDFPIQNLPFGAFTNGENSCPSLGVAIGDQVLDLEAAAGRALLDDVDDITYRGMQGIVPEFADGAWAGALDGVAPRSVSICSARTRRSEAKPKRACVRSRT